MLTGNQGKSVLLLLGAVLFWSGNNVVAKAIIVDVPPYSFTFLRWLIASLIMLPFTWSYVRRDWRTARQAWVRLTLIAVLGISAFNTLLYMAVQTTSAVNVGLISSFFPAAIAMFSWVLLKIRLDRIQITGMAISFLGILLVISQGHLSTLTGMVFVEGDLLMFLGVICGAIYPVLLHKKPAIHPLSLLTIIILFGMVVSLPLYLLDLWQGHYVTVNGGVVSGLLYIAVFPSVLAYMLWNRGIELVGANRAGLYLNLIPILTAIMAAVFLDETLRWYHFAGLLLVISGMALFNLKQLLNPAPAQP
jgi:drug/metabolite transporter (DMT)-like permease